jgi:glycogen synthase
MNYKPIKKLENKEDLQLLLEGNRINVILPKYKGALTFAYEDEGTLHLVKKKNGRILEYFVEEIWTKVKDGFLFQTKKFEGRGEPSEHKKGSNQYDNFLEVIDN